MAANPDHASNFEVRVYAALEAFERDYRVAVQANTPTPRLSVKSFMETSNISRARLYEKYPGLKAQVESRLADLQAEADAYRRASRKRSVKSLTEELSLFRKDAARRYDNAVSISFTELMDRGGPTFRERQHLMQEIQQRDQIIATLEQKVERLLGLNASLMAQLNQ